MSNTQLPYLHGFSSTEQERLRSSAKFAEQTIYKNVDFTSAQKILEVACGVGAQTEILLRRFPNLFIEGIDLSEKQLAQAKEHLATVPWAKDRYHLSQMNAQHLEFNANTFDGAFLCWILEHVPSPKTVLSEVRRVLRPGGKVYITEMMSHTFFLEPYSPNVWQYWLHFTDFQYEKAGDPFVGVKLGNMLSSVGFQNIETNQLTWHFDNRRPQQRKDAIEFWSDFLMSAANLLIDEGKVTKELVAEVQKDLKNVATHPDSVFYYTFLQASGINL